MAEKIFTSALTEIGSRDPAKRYKYTTHPDTLENIYVELSPAELAQRVVDESAHQAKIEKEAAEGPAKTLEDRVRELEAQLAALKGKP